MYAFLSRQVRLRFADDGPQLNFPLVRGLAVRFSQYSPLSLFSTPGHREFLCRFQWTKGLVPWALPFLVDQDPSSRPSSLLISTLKLDCARDVHLNEVERRSSISQGVFPPAPSLDVFPSQPSLGRDLVSAIFMGFARMRFRANRRFSLLKVPCASGILRR